MESNNDIAQSTWGDVEAILMQWSHLGVENQSNGTCLIGHVPHVAPLAWFHQKYRALELDEIIVLESKLGRALPDAYRSFLGLCNGLKAFSNHFSIFGMPRSFSRTAFHAREPYDLVMATLHTGYLPGLLCFGMIEEDFLYCEWDTGHPMEIFSCPKYKIDERHKSWPDYWTMLQQEVSRLAGMFDEHGRKIIT